MTDNAVSTNKLKKKEVELKASQAEHANKLMNYISDRVGKKLNPSEVYHISLQMFDSDPIVNNLMSSLEKIIVEQKHVSELVKEISDHLESRKEVKDFN